MAVRGLSVKVRKIHAPLWGVLATLAACGGGSVASPSGVQVVDGGTTAPAPTPTPTSTPTPSSTAAPAGSAPKVAYGYTLAAAAPAPQGVALPIGKCIGMGSTLDLDVEGQYRRAILDSDFTNIKSAGFTTVRIPVKFSAHSANITPYTIDPAFLARVKYITDVAVRSGLNVIIDMHNFTDIMSNPSGNAIWFNEMWRQIGMTLKDEPSSVWFELLNEPTGNMNNQKSIWTFYNPAIAAIRANNPTRTIIVANRGSSTALGSSVDSLADFDFPHDPNIVPTFHTYDPMQFTHQGATWVVPIIPYGRTYGTPDDLAALNANVAKVKSFIARTGRVPFLGEYGVMSDPEVPLSERTKYYGTVSAAYASIGVQSCAWSYRNGFIFYDDATGWVPGMVDSLQTPTTLLPTV